MYENKYSRQVNALGILINVIKIGTVSIFKKMNVNTSTKEKVEMGVNANLTRTSLINSKFNGISLKCENGFRN